MMQFEIGDFVRTIVGVVYYYGQVTEVRPDGYCKVVYYESIYEYFHPSELELMRPEDLKDE
jgi:hypothetical protein